MRLGRPLLKYATAYGAALQRFKQGDGDIGIVMNAAGRPGIVEIVDDVVKMGCLLTEKGKADMIRVFVRDSMNSGKPEWVSATFHQLFTRLAQAGSSKISLELLTVALEGSIALKYPRYAELLMLQLVSELRKSGQMMPNVDHTALLNELLARLTPDHEQPRIERAKHLISQCVLVGIIPDSTSASLLLSLAAVTCNPSVISTTKSIILNGTLYDFPDISTDPRFYLSLLSAYSSVAVHKTVHHHITRTLQEMKDNNVHVQHAHYQFIISSYINICDAQGFDIINEYCKKPDIMTLDSLLLACACNDSAAASTHFVKAQNLPMSDLKHTATLAYHKHQAKQQEEAKIAAVKDTLQLYEKLSETKKQIHLEEVLEVLAEAGDVKHLEDMLSCQPNGHKAVLSRGYTNARTRAEAQLFPVHYVLKGDPSEAPNMHVPAIMRHTPPTPPEPAPQPEVQKPIRPVVERPPKEEQSNPVPSQAKGTAPSGIYTAALRVGPDGQPLTRKRHPINQNFTI